VRYHYETNYKLSKDAKNAEFLNPGSNWVSYISVEPKVAAAILRESAERFAKRGKLRIFMNTAFTKLEMDPANANKIAMVRTKEIGSGKQHEFSPRFVLDATDVGAVIAAVGREGSDWVVGAESAEQTGEPDAPPTPRRHYIQPLTFPFAVDWSPETIQTNVIQPPPDYAELRALQNYHAIHGAMTGFFTGDFPWWSYRRVLAKANFDDPRIQSDLVMVNTAGNDFYGGNILGCDTTRGVAHTRTGADSDSHDISGINGGGEELLDKARRASLGYLYWLQTECQREDDPTKYGYPELRLRKDVFDTADGCSIKPYIRESRRIIALRTIREQEIVVKDFSGVDCRGPNARAAFMADSVGIGFYALDIHHNGHGERSAYVATRPFQIPLGAMVPVRLENVLPACKNIGTTHLTNGAYRLHPIEWNIGESAAHLALLALKLRVTPRTIYENESLRLQLQEKLLDDGISLYWFVDVPLAHPAFKCVQTLAQMGVPLGSDHDLFFHPERYITTDEWQKWLQFTKVTVPLGPAKTRAEAATVLYDRLQSARSGNLQLT
jgi:hypothetical protein